MAAYLATHGFENQEIADALGVGSRTVSQYISVSGKVNDESTCVFT